MKLLKLTNFSLKRGVWQTHDFNVFAHKLGNQRGIYFFLKLPVWVKIIKNVGVFQPENPKKKFFFRNSVTSNLTIFFESREFFYSSKSKKKCFSFDRDRVKNQNNLNCNIFVPEFDFFCPIFRLFS